MLDPSPDAGNSISDFLSDRLHWRSLKEVAEPEQAHSAAINATKLNALADPVPPLPEQRRIVGILDEAFEGIATAKANAEKNLQNARALFESHLQSVFTQRGEGWAEKQLDAIWQTRLTVGQSADG